MTRAPILRTLVLLMIAGDAMSRRSEDFDFGKANFFILGFIAFVMAGGVPKITAPMLIPFTIAVLLSFVLEPVVVALERMKMPRIAAILLVILFMGRCSSSSDSSCSRRAGPFSGSIRNTRRDFPRSTPGSRRSCSFPATPI